MDIDYQQFASDLDSWKMLVDTFADLAALLGIRFARRSRLNEAFRDGSNPLRPETAKEIFTLRERVSDLVERALPFPLNLDDAERIYILLQLIDDGADLAVGRPITVNEKQ